MKKFIGQHGALYEINESGFDFKVTKPDGKIFYIPIKDAKDILEVMDLEIKKEALESRLLLLNSNKPKTYAK